MVVVMVQFVWSGNLLASEKWEERGQGRDQVAPH